jgi:hypothetical protein
LKFNQEKIRESRIQSVPETLLGLKVIEFTAFQEHWWINEMSHEIKNFINFKYPMIKSKRSSIYEDYCSLIDEDMKLQKGLLGMMQVKQ